MPYQWTVDGEVIGDIVPFTEAEICTPLPESTMTPEQEAQFVDIATKHFATHPEHKRVTFYAHGVPIYHVGKAGLK